MSYQVTAPHFCVGIETDDRDGEEVIIEAAPILRWAIGKTLKEFCNYCSRKGWEVEDV
jgi:hypothetical protein